MDEKQLQAISDFLHTQESKTIGGKLEPGDFVIREFVDFILGKVTLEEAKEVYWFLREIDQVPKPQPTKPPRFKVKEARP